ncbi:flavin-containing monooxygenase 5 [Aplysia californica]|uniref:Flavin-containing monooxygenase n=1 Tax=Aplysia californica TaxID=6500 RepID=A0ABM0ZVP7_APLCA|nr:flavin-containing monooxygenase 5 [Aplysia californica]
MGKRVLVIGAGCAGLTCIKSCLDEGLEPVCMERTDIMGGLWYFKERHDQWPEQGSVNRSTVINTSKEMMAFSDYPLPADYANFVHNTKVLEYFRDFAQHFGLNKYIHYNKEVVLVKRAKDFDRTGQWDVESRDHKSGAEKTEVFDFVLVCSGHHAQTYKPDFPGIKDFQGKVIHSKEFKDCRGFEGKKVMVVGIGNSGGDCASELAKYSWVILSTRRGAWIQNRIGPHGIPLDIGRTRRFNLLLKSFMPRWFFLWQWKRLLNYKMNHDIYSMTPDFEPDATHPTVNDDMANRIAAGMIKVKPDIRRFTKTGVEFVDGSFEDNVDTVILATGYVIGFPMVEKGVIDVKENNLKLYKHMFCPDLTKPTIAFIGNIQPLGSIMPIAELQGRVAVRVFKGLCQLPSREEMWESIKARQARMGARYVKSKRHTIQVDLIPFCDELADMIGVKPNLAKLWLTDPVLAREVFFGPSTPYQYRLQGPCKWSGARETILTQMDRVRQPLQTRPLPRKAGDQSISFIYILIAVILPALLYFFRFI